MKNVKVATANIRVKQLFFHWMEITKPFHGLTNQQQKIVALLLYYHYTFQRDITNMKIVWKMVFDYDTKLKIKEELGIKDAVFQNMLYLLRKKGVIKNNKVVPLFIPVLTQDSTNFKIIFNFNIIHERGQDTPD